MTYDFIVIGGGVSGITSALILARNGYQVAIVERAEQLAPVVRGFSRAGLQFDTGFHYTGGLGAGEPLDLFFRYLGVADRLVSFPFSEQGFDIFRSCREGFELRLPAGYRPLRDSMADAFPRDIPAIDRYLGMVKDICASMPYLNLDADFGALTSLQSIHGPSLEETLDSLTDNKLLKSLLSMHSLLYGVSPEEVPFSQHARIVGNYYLSARGIRGGGVSLVRAFEARLGELGVDVCCGSEVAALTVTAAGAVAGVRLGNGDELGCRGCIATLHPRSLADLVPDGLFRPSYRKRLKALEETVSAFMLFAVADAPIPVLAGANLFLFPDAERLSGLGTRGPEETPLYLTGAYRDGGSEPHGFIAISPALFGQMDSWADSVTGSRPAGYRQFKKEMSERMQRHIEICCPELGGTIHHAEGATPLTLRDYGSAPLGGLYGVKHMVGQYNPLPLTRVKGLFLAGQAVVSPGILGAVLSGFVACGAILGHDRLRKELKGCS